MSGKESQEELAHAKYWDNRYTEKSATEDKYDWLRDCAAVKPFLMKHLPDASRDNPRIVQLGCGNSVSTHNSLQTFSVTLTRFQTLTQDVQSLGYTNQISIDFSQIVIEQMRAKHLGLHWQVMDVRDMGFESASFDIAIDKTTLDAMLYGSLWDPEDEVKKNVKAYVDEVC